ncbi:MAG: amidase [Acidimicrobiia bacterium]
MTVAPEILTASETAAGVRRGALSPIALTTALLARIEALEPQIGAWVGVDARSALAQAARLEAGGPENRPVGPLAGVCVGLKDIFDVAGMVTTAGASAFAHRLATRDATAVSRLRQAGAIVLGKTVTTEFAYLDPAGTRNPWNLDHTPGGSSSGSAAAVASGMVPLALGTQTVGSTLRPAGYCGIVGFKGTHGRISCSGVVPLAWSLDHVGILCRSVADAALALEVLAGHDPTDPVSAASPEAGWTLSGKPFASGRTPTLGLPPSSLLHRASPAVVRHIEDVAGAMERRGATLVEVVLPGLGELESAGARILRAEAAAAHADRFVAHSADYRPLIRGLIEAGQAETAVDQALAQRCLLRFRQASETIFEGIDALLSPVAATPAPRGLAATGDPAFCAPWTYSGLPAISIPSGLDDHGLPLAVQLVSRAFDEAGLLAVASWCEAALGFSSAPPDLLGRD